MPESAVRRPPLDPGLFGDGPARDGRFTVREVWAELVNLPEGTPEQSLEFLHRQMNEEMCVMENAARSLAEFPDADWSVRKGLARQCADEARHTMNYHRLFEQRGGTLGQYPIMNFQYRILGRIDNLVGRLSVQNRSFEADGLDAATYARDEARARGDDQLADMYDAQQADEVVHIRFANEYIRKELASRPRIALDMARALTQSARAFAQIFADGGTEVHKYGVAVEARLEAGFSPEEVEVAVRMSDERRAGVRERLGLG
jgi:uncharacterized ferritin-like protein (DUF455 family)